VLVNLCRDRWRRLRRRPREAVRNAVRPFDRDSAMSSAARR
jgi:hypothetical protein